MGKLSSTYGSTWKIAGMTRVMCQFTAVREIYEAMRTSPGHEMGNTEWCPMHAIQVEPAPELLYEAHRPGFKREFFQVMRSGRIYLCAFL